MRNILAGAVLAGVIPARYCHCIKRFCCCVQIRSVPCPQFAPSQVPLPLPLSGAAMVTAMESVDTVKLSNRIKQSWVGAHSALLPPWKVER